MLSDLTVLHAVILTLASYRLSRLVVQDTLLAPFRDRVWDRYPPETHRIGYLLTCFWCTSFYTSSLVVISYMIVPAVTLPICLILALSALVGIISTKID